MNINLNEDDEVVRILKTSTDKVEMLEKYIETNHEYEIFDIAAQLINDNSEKLDFPENFIAKYMSHNRKSWPMTGYHHILQSNHQYCLLRSLQFPNNEELISKICDELNIDWNLWLEFQGDTNYEYSG